jgi:hypothetical protein
MEKPAKKLVLSKETLCTLDDDQLADVVGGQPTNGVVCVNTVLCNSGVCGSAVCRSAVCGSVACGSVAICNVG